MRGLGQEGAGGRDVGERPVEQPGPGYNLLDQIGIGRGQPAVGQPEIVLEADPDVTAAGLGGHVRVGFENNLWLADGRLAASNADLVEQAAAGARLLGRPLADIATTRAFLAESAR